ncbi:MAG: hypothetical protein ACTHJM_15085 [Marmoricola sp.]
MTDMSMRGTGDEIAALRAHLEKLEQRMQAEVPARDRARRSWRRPLALASIAVLIVGTLAGVAGAIGTTTDVAFLSLSPAHAVLTNTTIAAHKTSSPVVIGGTTTVPSNATTVELTVTAKGPSVGTLEFYPAQNPSGGSGQALPYPGSNVVASATIEENVGQSGELTILNNGIGSAVVTAKIIGYSTQVTAGDINSVGGSNGQVLTSDGTGDASWTTQGQAFSSTSGFASVPHVSLATVDSVVVPPGTYNVIDTYSGYSSVASDFLQCWIVLPDGHRSQESLGPLSQAYGSTYYGAGTAEGLITTSVSEQVSFECDSFANPAGATVVNETLTATQVGSASGAVVSSRRGASQATTLPIK